MEGVIAFRTLRDQQCTIGQSVGGTPNFEPKYCQFVAESEWFDLIGPFGAKPQHGQPEQVPDSEIEEGSELPTCPVPLAIGPTVVDMIDAHFRVPGEGSHLVFAYTGPLGPGKT